MARCRLTLKHFIRSTFLSISILQWILAPISFAAEIEIKTRMNIRQQVNGGLLETTTTLPIGTIVKIPDDFLKNQPQGTLPEQALVNWLRHNTKLFPFTDNQGNLKHEHFNSVEIVSVPDKNLKYLEGQSFYMALKFLAERPNGLSFTTTDSSPIYVRHEPKPQALPAPQETQTEAACGSCYIPDPTPKVHVGQGLQDIKNLTQDWIQKTDSLSERFKQNKPLDGVVRNFKRSCGKLDFENFKSFLKEESEKNNVPLEVMLGIMTQESAGECFSESSGNYGLFQINKSTSSHVSVCSQNQIAQIQKSSFQDLKTNKDLQCLQNPIVNAREGVRILLEKYQRTNNNKPASLQVWNQYSSQERDNFRRAIVAYNGGELYVNLAKKDLKNFQKSYASDLTPDSFELQKLFFFRQALRNNRVDLSPGRTRSTRNSLRNLAYTESIAGKEVPPPDLVSDGFITLWGERLSSSSQIAKN